MKPGAKTKWEVKYRTSYTKGNGSSLSIKQIYRSYIYLIVKIWGIIISHDILYSWFPLHDARQAVVSD